jgi:hypothetical protein
MQEIFAAGLHESINQSIKSYANKKELLTHIDILTQKRLQILLFNLVQNFVYKFKVLTALIIQVCSDRVLLYYD